MRNRNVVKFTTPRSTVITKKLRRDRRASVSVYGGMSTATYRITLRKDMRGHLVGEFALTKKIGKHIHDSARAQKRKNKKKNKK
jgi:ribosomal protein S19